MTTRRDFLKKSAVASIGALLLTDTFSVNAQQNKHVGLFKLDDIKDYDYLLKNKPEHYKNFDLNLTKYKTQENYYSNKVVDEIYGQILLVDYGRNIVTDFRFLNKTKQLVEGTVYSALSHEYGTVTKNSIRTTDHDNNVKIITDNSYDYMWSLLKINFDLSCNLINLKN